MLDQPMNSNFFARVDNVESGSSSDYTLNLECEKQPSLQTSSL